MVHVLAFILILTASCADIETGLKTGSAGNDQLSNDIETERDAELRDLVSVNEKETIVDIPVNLSGSPLNCFPRKDSDNISQSQLVCRYKNADIPSVDSFAQDDLIHVTVDREVIKLTVFKNLLPNGDQWGYLVFILEYAGLVELIDLAINDPEVMIVVDSDTFRPPRGD